MDNQQGEEVLNQENQPVKSDESDESDVVVEELKVDWSEIPEKYMKDGEPNVLEINKARAELEKKFHELSGATKVPDEYVLTEGNHFDYFEDIDQDQYQTFLKDAKELGFTNDQFQLVMSNLQQVYKTMPHLNTDQSEFETEWGDKAKQNLSIADRAVMEYFPGNISEHPELAQHPQFIRTMLNIGKQMKETQVDVSKSQDKLLSQYTEGDIMEIMGREDFNNRSDLQNVVDTFFKTKYGE